ncbi:MAG: hypothetical protein Fur0046_34690 [Cyanobacteria bacterium J069]
MLKQSRQHSKTALLLAIGMTTTSLLPMWTAQQAIAQPLLLSQVFSNPARVGLPAGTILPVAYSGAEKVVVLPNETAPLTLTLTNDVRTPSGTVLLRAGSEIKGELRPVEGGTQFFAQSVTPLGSSREIPLDATSNRITQRETITRRNRPDVLRGAAIGAAAAAVLAEVFGSIDVVEVLAGAGVGAAAELLIRRNRRVEVLVVEPRTDLTLTLQSAFSLQ